jgi:hypothetical protein
MFGCAFPLLRVQYAGTVVHVRLDRAAGAFVTASSDGWVRWWPFTAVDAAEPHGAEHALDVSVNSCLCLRYTVLMHAYMY